MTAFRRCRYCGLVLLPNPTKEKQRAQHCQSPRCDWCLTCVAAMYAGEHLTPRGPEPG